MPFAFWKSAKTPEASPLLSDAAVREELSLIIPSATAEGGGKVDLNPGGQDAGVFLFDEDAREIDGNQTPVIGPALEQSLEKEGSAQKGSEVAETSLLDLCEKVVCPERFALVPEGVELETAKGPAPREKLKSTFVEEFTPVEPLSENRKEDSSPVESPRSPGDSSPVESPRSPGDSSPPVESLPNTQDTSPVESLPATKETSPPAEPPTESRPLAPNESGPILTVQKRAPAALVKVETNLRDRDSGVYLSDSDNSPARSRPSSVISNDSSPLRSRVTSLSKPSASPRAKSIARLQRPAELNLGFSAPDPAKPKSELDMRYDLIRNSKTRSKAALRSPTQLLQDRLNMSPKKKDAEEKVRVFTPPRATVNGCLLPGPGAQAEAFTSTSVRARTEAGARPAWWCKFDKLVVFDGIEHADGELRLRTRTSKGLTIARRRGDLETVVIPLDCAHCHEMLNRHEWKYDIRVCKRSVCWDCKERCKWEFEQEKLSVATPRADANRERADSMLQDEQHRSNESRREIVA